ncbi:MAG TPA: GNAT family N-acetyltransferase [Chthoniobacterales bacterium]
MIVPRRVIRQANADDGSANSAIDPESERSSRKHLTQRAISDGNAYVVEENESITAVGILEYTFFEYGFVPLIYVHLRNRHAGVGELLLRDLVSRCRTIKVFSSTNLSNAPMHGLFHKLEFEVTGMLHHLDPSAPEIIYVKAL